MASVRKSLQGLDSYAAEGGRGFDDLLSLVDTMVKYGANEAVIAELKDNFRHIYIDLARAKSEAPINSNL